MALRSPDSVIRIGNIKLAPKIVVIEVGKILKYEIELYTIDKELLNTMVKEIVLSVQYNDRIAELTIAVDNEAGHLYLIPSSVANEELLTKILDFIRSKAEC